MEGDLEKRWRGRDSEKRWRGIKKRDGGGFKKVMEGGLEKKWRGI